MNTNGLRWKVIRWGIILPMILILFVSSFKSVIDYLDNKIATSNGVEVTKNHFYPALTICPYANEETARSIRVTENDTFPEAVQKSLKPGIRKSGYILT